MLLDISVLIFYIFFVLYERKNKRKNYISCVIVSHLIIYYYKINCNSREIKKTKKFKKNYVYIENDLYFKKNCYNYTYILYTFYTRIIIIERKFYSLKNYNYNF